MKINKKTEDGFHYFRQKSYYALFINHVIVRLLSSLDSDHSAKGASFSIERLIVVHSGPLYIFGKHHPK